MVSEELVKNYIDHLRHLSYCKNLRTQETAQKRRARACKSYGDNNREEILLTEGLNFFGKKQLKKKKKTGAKYHSFERD